MEADGIFELWRFAEMLFRLAIAATYFPKTSLGGWPKRRVNAREKLLTWA